MKFKQFRDTASKHPRYGSRATRAMSKTGIRAISGEKLERLLRKARQT